MRFPAVDFAIRIGVLMLGLYASCDYEYTQISLRDMQPPDAKLVEPNKSCHLELFYPVIEISNSDSTCNVKHYKCRYLESQPKCIDIEQTVDNASSNCSIELNASMNDFDDKIDLNTLLNIQYRYDIERDACGKKADITVFLYKAGIEIFQSKFDLDALITVGTLDLDSNKIPKNFDSVRIKPFTHLDCLNKSQKSSIDISLGIQISRLRCLP